MTKLDPRPNIEVRVQPLPSWLDAERLLGPGFVRGVDANGLPYAEARLTRADAGLLDARLRGLGIDGRELQVQIYPPLTHQVVRDSRLAEARAQRYTTPGFSNQAARATGEGRFSLTPEPLALAIGKLADGRSVVDACCGSGGNSLGFARAGCPVTAIEIDRERLGEARHNAVLYHVNDRIQFIHGDALQAVSTLRAHILFVDPPWGEKYDKRRTRRQDFPLLDALLDLPLHANYQELWLKVPGSFATGSVPPGTACALFGEASGDQRRIKFLLLRVPLTAPSGP